MEQHSTCQQMSLPPSCTGLMPSPSAPPAPPPSSSSPRRLPKKEQRVKRTPQNKKKTNTVGRSRDCAIFTGARLSAPSFGVPRPVLSRAWTKPCCVFWLVPRDHAQPPHNPRTHGGGHRHKYLVTAGRAKLWQKKREEKGNFKTDIVPWRTGIVSQRPFQPVGTGILLCVCVRVCVYIYIYIYNCTRSCAAKRQPENSTSPSDISTARISL